MKMQLELRSHQLKAIKDMIFNMESKISLSQSEKVVLSLLYKIMRYYARTNKEAKSMALSQQMNQLTRLTWEE